MAKLLLNFRGVPDDEIDEIRELLKSNGIETYETEPNAWMISAGGIWLANNEQHDQAEDLLNQYQSTRTASARTDFLQREAEGKNPTLMDKIIEDPVRFIFYLLVIGVILYFSIQPFLGIGE